MKKMDTYFAPAERANEKELNEIIRRANPRRTGEFYNISG